jgi:hypothetical protein
MGVLLYSVRVREPQQVAVQTSSTTQQTKAS